MARRSAPTFGFRSDFGSPVADRAERTLRHSMKTRRQSSRTWPIWLAALGVGTMVLSAAAKSPQSSRKSKGSEPDRPAVSRGAPSSFAPLPEDHELASFWNDPEFTKRLLGSYGFAADIEPRLTPEEQAAYRDKVAPLLREDPQKAVDVLSSMVKPEGSALFDFLLGNVRFQAEDLTNAVQHFEAAIAKFPDFRRAQKSLGFALVRDGRYADAIKPLHRTVALGGADGKVFGLLGFAYLSLGRHVSAEAAYRQALVFEPDNLDCKLGLVKSAIGASNYDYALALLDELLKEFPEREQLWMLQANLHIQREQPAEAALSLELVRRAGKANAASLYLLGDLYLAQEAPDLALEAYLAALARDQGQPNPAKALRAAQILVGRGAYGEGTKLLTGIRQAMPGLSETDDLRLLKLESRIAMAAGAGDKAIATLEQIIQKNPLDGEALLLAGDYYARNDQKEQAAFRYQTAANLEEFKAEAWVKQAQLMVQSRKYPEAVELLRRAQKLKPRDHVQRYLDKVELAAGRSERS